MSQSISTYIYTYTEKFLTSLVSEHESSGIVKDLWDTVSSSNKDKPEVVEFGVIIREFCKEGGGR